MVKTLIIEDDRDIARILYNSLKPLTLSDPIVAYNMEEAMKIIDSTNPVDLVTLDLGLPDSGTEETVKNKIKEIRGKQPNCLLLVITGAMRASFEEEVIKQGADGFMEKLENCRSPKTFMGTLGDIIRSIARQPVRYQKNLPLLEKLTARIHEHVTATAKPV